MKTQSTTLPKPIILFVLFLFTSLFGTDKCIASTEHPDVDISLDDCVEDLSNDQCLIGVNACAEATDVETNSDDLIFSYRIDLYSDGQGDLGSFDHYVGRLSKRQQGNGIQLEPGVDDCQNYNAGGYCNPYALDPGNPFCADGAYPVGTHTFVWVVEDEDGNVTEESIEVDVQDCVSPSLIVIDSILTKTMPPRGEICFDPEEFIVSMEDNCTENAGLRAYFNNDPQLRQYCITCDSFECRGADDRIIIDVKVNLLDEAGNHDQKVGTMMIRDDNDVCGSRPFMIFGSIYNEHCDAELSNVQLRVSGDLPQPYISEISDRDYYFRDIAWQCTDTSAVYMIQLFKDDHPLNGVSTADVIALQRHLLGKASLEDGFQIVAGDVNNDQRISVGDVAALLKLILGKTKSFNSFNNQTSYRFFQAEFNLINELNPWPLPEVHVAKYHGGKRWGPYDFNYVKIGDVTGDAQCIEGNTSSTRFDQQTSLYIEDELLSKDETYTVFVRSSDAMQLSGIQAAFEVNNNLAEIISIESELPDFGEHHINTTAKSQGNVKIAWFHPLGESSEVAKDDPLFAIRLRPKSMTRISDIVRLSDNFLNEAYNNELQKTKLLFNVRREGDLNRLKLYQSVPNPAPPSGDIYFDYYTPVAGDVTVRFYSSDGVKLLETKSHAISGMNRFGTCNVPYTGILFYEIEINGERVTKKAIFR